MFIEPDEHLIVMEDDFKHPFDDADLLALSIAGIRTIEIPHAIRKFYGEIRYEDDFKILLPFYYSDESFVEIVQDKDRIEAWARDCTSYGDIRRRQFIFGLPGGGEFLWDANLIDDYPLSDDEIIDFVVDIQKILYEQHGEIWLSLHNFMGNPLNWNNTRLPKLYQALRDWFPSAPIYSLQYIHFSCGGTPTPVEMQEKITTYTDQFGIRFFVGPDYCEGLVKNFDTALAQKAWGFVCAPLHDENPVNHQHIQPWMVDVLRDADKKLKEHYGDNALQPIR